MMIQKTSLILLLIFISLWGCNKKNEEADVSNISVSSDRMDTPQTVPASLPAMLPGSMPASLPSGIKSTSQSAPDSVPATW